MFKEFFEDTVAADIAQATPPNKPLRKRKDDGPCKDLEGQTKADCKKEQKNVTEASKKVRMLEKELKNLIEYTGKYALIDSKPEYYDSVLYVEDRNDNIYSIIISEVIK